MKELISSGIQRSIETKQLILSRPDLISAIENAASAIIECYKNGGKVLFCGNGGSAADAQHLAAELSGRFGYDRPPLEAEALHVNTSFLTAVANDYSFDVVYERMVEASGKQGDVLVGLSTSGNSSNVVRAFEQAKSKGLTTIAFTGESGGKMATMADCLINVPSEETPRIQESHILIGHIICQIIESSIFPR
jgi:D-sedoheptulose 7-phosphate isomerase